MINIMFCGNHAVFDGMLMCAISIFKRTKTKEPFSFYILTMDVSYIKPDYRPIGIEQSALFTSVIKSYNEKNELHLIDVTELYREEFDGSPNENAYCSPYTVLRLLADRVDAVPDKLLYLDADTLFNRDAELLWRVDVSDVEYAAARDRYGKYLVNPNYINAGVLLLNIKKMRETGILARARALLRKKKLPFADQSALIRETTKKKIISGRFNSQKTLNKSTVVRHFSKRLFVFPYPHTENIKQWQIDRVRRVFGYTCFDDVFDEYMTLTHRKDKAYAEQNDR